MLLCFFLFSFSSFGVEVETIPMLSLLLLLLPLRGSFLSLLLLIEDPRNHKGNDCVDFVPVVAASPVAAGVSPPPPPPPAIEEIIAITEEEDEGVDSFTEEEDDEEE